MIHNRPILSKVIKGFGLVSIERFGRIGLNLISQFFIAKYLGPERYGQVSIPVKYIGLFMTIPVFGMDELLVKELIKAPNDRDQFSIIKATVMTRFALAAFAAALALISAYFSFGFGTENFNYVSLCCVILFLYPFFSLELFFQKGMNFNIAFRSKFMSSVGITAARLFGAIKSFSVIYFILVNIAEYFFLMILYILSSANHLKDLISVKADYSKLRTILKEAAPLAIASFMILAEQRYSLILLERHRPASEVGLFALSLTALDVLQYVPMALGLATFPVLVTLYESSVDQFREKIRSVIGIISSLSIFGFIFSYFIGEFLISITFGSRYQGLGTLINWIFLASFFYNANQIRIRWLVIRGSVKIWLVYSIVSLGFSIVMQNVFVPKFGALGVYYAWIIGQITSNVVVAYFSEDFRETFIALITSPLELLKSIQNYFSAKKI